MKFADLPKLLDRLDGGTFVGVTTTTDGIHCAVVLLPNSHTAALSVASLLESKGLLK